MLLSPKGSKHGMALALEAVDLTAICVLLVAIALLYMAVGMARAIAGVLDVSILGQHPFSGLANALRNSIIKWLNSAIGWSENAVVVLWKGLIWSINLMIKGVTDLANGIEASLTHGWEVTLPASFRALYDWSHAHFQATTAHFLRLENTVRDDYASATHFATIEAIHAKEAAERYAASEVAALRAAVVARLKPLEHFVGVEFPSDLAHVEHTATSILDELRRAEALARERALNLPTDIDHELNELAKYAGAAGIGALLAAVPYLLNEVATLEAEAGLTRLECRTKVKGICGIDPTAWAGLLGALAISDIGIHLGTLLPIAREAVNDFASVIREAG